MVFETQYGEVTLGLAGFSLNREDNLSARSWMLGMCIGTWSSERNGKLCASCRTQARCGHHMNTNCKLWAVALQQAGLKKSKATVRL